MSLIKKELDQKISFNAFKKQVLDDYRTIVESRECAILGRREVLSGKNPNAFEQMKGNTLEDVSKKEEKNPYDGRTKDAKAFLERMAKRNG